MHHPTFRALGRACLHLHAALPPPGAPGQAAAGLAWIKRQMVAGAAPPVANGPATAVPVTPQSLGTAAVREAASSV